MTSGSAVKRARERQEILEGIKAKQHAAGRKRRVLIRSVSVAALLVVVALISWALITSKPKQDTATRIAPDFSMTDTSGVTHTLSSERGHPVLLYFSEGAGCQACIVQQQKDEQEAGFAAAGITVWPIVMDKAADITQAAAAVGAKTPFLLDDGTVSKEYGTLGTGMHAGLPGHGFVLVDANGNQVWKGDYPSMWIDPKELLTIVKGKLGL
jgi:peroxiredoxin